MEDFDLFKVLGGRKSAMAFAILGVATTVEVLSGHGISGYYCTLLLGVFGAFSAANVANTPRPQAPSAPVPPSNEPHPAITQALADIQNASTLNGQALGYLVDVVQGKAQPQAA